MALSFFPQPYPDEIMYSVIARYHHISGNLSKSSSMKDLFNYSHILPSIALQARLGVLAVNIERFGIHFDTLLSEHTMFPYLMVFTPPGQYERVYNGAKHSFNGFDRMAIGALGRKVYPEKMMYCPKCVKEDILLLGEAYWHRIHQTPGIAVCKKHRCHLLPSNIATFYHGIGSYQVLEDEVMQVTDPIKKHGYDDLIHNDGIFDDTKFLYDNFIRVRRLFTDYNYCFRDAFLPELTNKQLAKNGLLKEKEFIPAFLNFYGADYLSKIGLSIKDSLNHKWPINLCRKKSGHHTYALEYILMARFLFGSFEKFICEAENQSSFSISTPSINEINNISISTPSNKEINNISLERYRNKWLDLISQTSDKGRLAVRKLDSRTYIWLYRHDNEWLKQHLPKKKLFKPQPQFTRKYINWYERDKELSERVESVIESLKLIEGKPKRVSESRICIALNCKAMFRGNQSRLPLTSFAIKNAVETVDQFRLRRCFWIIDLLQKEGIHPTPEKVCAMLHAPNRSEWKKIVESILVEEEY